MISIPTADYAALLEDRRAKRLLEWTVREMLEVAEAGDFTRLPNFLERLHDILEDAE